MIAVLRILVGPLAWLAGFTAVYALHGMLCGHAIGGTVGPLEVRRLLMIAAYALAVLVQGGILWALYRIPAQTPFVAFVSRATGWTGLVAAVWTLAPTVFATSCG